MFGFTIVENLQKIDEDIKRQDLKYHSKRVMVSKEFTFDAAHHLHCYEGKCKNLHGHTYKVIFGISGFVDDIGLVIDFGDIKQIWKESIEVHLDHRYLNDTLPNMNTTAENMVVWIYNQMEEALLNRGDGSRVEFVKLYETPTSYAEARREWMRDE
ncbi:UNVERIFIED_CONTAM: 6-carboxytetrahydropterin synthase QueD [Halobacillus marinus]|uniref:6-carboxytetrahydropterin synthase QueD n=1 Tax=Bacillaceae TaxID=186817 RepID=UPI0002A4E4E0|nr:MULTISPECIES: 6-carboxytetrahydropterin synthase QueD [Bacillaceae]ELK48842.1 6-pyruvoyl tetrahydrobiopterin synthase [Halobacillus sp. BAB-2008]QHT45828.1 6-carboxytetrahydropterin synthase QueD [Bacillus sp. SB49]